MKHYPKWKYHKTEAAKVVENHHQEEELGPEWKDSPKDFGVITHPNPAEMSVEVSSEEIPSSEQETHAEVAEEQIEAPEKPASHKKETAKSRKK